MEMESRNSFGTDWANDPFATFANNGLLSLEKWPALTNSPSFTQSAFIPPVLLTHGSQLRYRQVTPPDELSPAEPPRHARETSIPVEQLKNEAALFPDHQIQALQSFGTHQKRSIDQQDDQEAASPKRRRTSKQSTANQVQPEDSTQPPKRKRGRPKSQPQMVEAYTVDGFPFQVSSARQSHLEKNRVAAHKCRQRKKDYIGGLEGRAREYSSKNKALKENVAMLREELLELKNEVLRHANCGFWAVDEYLTRCAGDLLGMRPPSQASKSPSFPLGQGLMQTANASTRESEDDYMPRRSVSDSLPSLGSADSPDRDENSGFEWLEDMDEDNKGMGL
jgi:hypothetical protein